MATEVDPLKRHRTMTHFTLALDKLSREHGFVIEGGYVRSIDLNWRACDAEQWEQYALNEDNFLVRGFWNHHLRSTSR